MAERESTAAGDAEKATDETEKPSLDPFPEVSRNAGNTTTSDERTAAGRAADDSETDAADQTDGDGETAAHSYGCDHDSDVPCRFQ